MSFRLMVSAAVAAISSGDNNYNCSLRVPLRSEVCKGQATQFVSFSAEEMVEDCHKDNNTN